MNRIINLETIEKSPDIAVNGEEIVDLTSSIMNEGEKMVFLENDKLYEVSSNLVSKIGLISRYVYGTSDKLDYLAYYNGFSNPFAIPAGFHLRVPDLTRISKSLKKNSTNYGNVAKSLLNKKKSVVDEKRKRMITKDLERVNMNKSLVQNQKLTDRIILNSNPVNRNKKINFFLESERKTDKMVGLTDFFEERLKL